MLMRSGSSLVKPPGTSGGSGTLTLRNKKNSKLSYLQGAVGIAAESYRKASILEVQHEAAPMTPTSLLEIRSHAALAGLELTELHYHTQLVCRDGNQGFMHGRQPYPTS